MLSRLALMVQAAVLDGQFFDPVSPFDDGGVAAEVGVGGRDVAEALVVAVVVIVIDEGPDLVFEIAWFRRICRGASLSPAPQSVSRRGSGPVPGPSGRAADAQSLIRNGPRGLAGAVLVLIPFARISARE